MGRNVFISFLGTNNYVECKYKMDGKASKPVRFIQEMLISRLCKKWNENDRIFIFCTTKDEKTGQNGSWESNWENDGQKNASEDIEKIGLKQRLEKLKIKMDLKAVIEPVKIKAGFTEDEIWSIFDTVYGMLQPYDKIYFDVTHAFRSIPLFSIVLFNYSKFMMNTQLVTIKYGAFEKLGPAKEAKQIPLNKRIAPVLDLTNIARLQEYNQLANELVEFGKVRKISDKISGGEKESTDDVIYNLCTSIEFLDEYISTIQLDNLHKGEFIGYFRDSYNYIQNRNKVPKPILEILRKLNEETTMFVDEENIQNIEAAIEWANKHDMIMQEYALAEEYVIFRVIDINSFFIPNDISRQDVWSLISSILSMPSDKFQKRVFDKEIFRKYPGVAGRIIDDSSLISDLREDYDLLRRIRNSLAHGLGFEHDNLQMSFKEIKDKFGELYISCKMTLDKYISY